MTTTMRPFHPSDLPGMYRVCLLTGAAGQDATALYRDPELLGHVYCGPYPTADPDLSLVVVDAQGVAGYVVATADTAAFQAWCERAWWPVLRTRYARTDDPGDGTQDHVLRTRLHEPDVAPAPSDAPAHLHIDLLPRLQGQGWGRRLIAGLADALRARDVPGVHLGVSAANARAIAFYEHLGFRRETTYDWGHRLVLDLRRDSY
ncbi:GNAT family N-acetyltransferase [Cellulomonas sp. S1-8]|uniref:GNAT family N-acetyltransferase n=1 Tax=Cellulomonas sp. S1-8 TaxID=2904790 RepID=UPI00224494C0|nr:GNAT family N-acetyltransferase [Cellulomonas sp. S1-8]UZN03537.1 GNAT family N-acetyltransferase [Cellulomonas sp. S1-8]